MEEHFSNPKWIVGYRFEDETVAFGKIDMSFMVDYIKEQFREYSRKSCKFKSEQVRQIEPVRVYKTLRDIPNADAVMAAMTFNKIAYPINNSNDSGQKPLGTDGLILSKNHPIGDRSTGSRVAIFNDIAAFAFSHTEHPYDWNSENINWYVFDVR